MKDIVASFSGLRVLVYGDFALDEFLYGQIDRISREAPVFIVSHQSSDFRPGCAANAAANIAALGATAIPVGVTGDDEYGVALRRAMETAGVDTGHILSAPSARTPLKTRVIAGGIHSIKQQIVRIDRLNGMPENREVDDAVRAHLSSLISEADAVMISDYGVGGLNLPTAQWLLKLARERGVSVLADSRYRLADYTGATAMTPNQPEAEELAKRYAADAEELHAIGVQLLERLRVEALVITRGAEGMTLFQQGKDPLDIAAFGDEEIVDVTGAGDTVIAAFTLGIAAGAGFAAAARVANAAGGLTVLKKGTATVSAAELTAALAGNGS